MAVPCPPRQHRRMRRVPGARSAALALVVVLTACARGAPAAPVTLELQELNDSGVSGSVTMTAIDDERTRVDVSVDPAGHESMPAHIHPGSCAELVPQPKYGLENVIDGESSTEVPASLTDLMSGGQALNIHMSNEEMGVYSACVDLS